MSAHHLSLAELFMQTRPGIVAITGGGGKTSLLFALGKALAESGAAVLCTTTTRMLRPAATNWLTVALADDAAGISPRPGALFAAIPPGKTQPQDKVYGYPAPALDRLWENNPAVWMLVEADGAAGRPLKAPATHEPVIPSRAAFAVAVVGLGCIGRPFAEDTVFRPEKLSALTGLRHGDTISPAALVPLISHPEGWFKMVPANCKRFLFCNQSDLPGAAEAGSELAREAKRVCPGFLDGFFVGSLKTEGLECHAYPTK